MHKFGIIFIIFLLVNDSYAIEVDLSEQFSGINKLQKANTCYLHAGISILEAKYYRDNQKHMSFDDSSIILRFLNRLVQLPPANDYLEASRAALADNLIFYSKGKFSSPVDFGYLAIDMLKFIVSNGLIENTGVHNVTLRDQVSSEIHDISIEASKTVLNMGLPNHPANLPPEEALRLEPLANATSRIVSLTDEYLKTVDHSNIQYSFSDFFELQLDPENQGEKGEVARFNLKEAMKSYYWPQNPTEQDRINLEDRRQQCSNVSKIDQVQILNKLQEGLPLAVGVFTIGAEFGDGKSFKKIYKTNGHAMTLVGIKTVKNDFGVDEDYWYFRDSGFFQGSTIARFPVRESCRFLKVIGIK